MNLSRDIFNYPNVRALMQDVMRAHPGRGRRKVTLDWWAKRLGYRSPRTIAMVLRGQRPPSVDFVRRLTVDLELDHVAARYVEIIGQVDRQRHKAPAEIDPDLVREATTLRGAAGGDDLVLPNDVFVTVAEWYHFVLKQLATTADFREDPEWLRQRLGGKLTNADAKRALATLVRVGLLRRDEETGRLMPAHANATTGSDIPSSAIKSHHRQMLARASEALQERDVAEREFRSATFTFDKSQLAEAKERLRQFHREFEQRFSQPGADAVFQCNIQLFEHTRAVPAAAAEGSI